VSITYPLDGATVQPQFVIRVDATDNIQVASAELRIDGQSVLTLTQGPWVFNAPAELGQGNHNVEVIARDNRGDQGSDSISVVLGAPCGGSNDCSSGDACVDGRCVPGARSSLRRPADRQTSAASRRANGSPLPAGGRAVPAERAARWPGPGS